MADIDRLLERVAALESRVERQADRIEELETELETERQARAKAEARVEDLEATAERQDALLEGLQNRVETSRRMIATLQSRELEKGAHLPWEQVKPTLTDDILNLPGGKVERISKDDGRYVRLPESEDPLERGGSIQLAPGDLLPIQQLAQFDDETLAQVADSRPDRLAATVWRARNEPSDDLWNRGCSGVREYLDAGELATWIRVKEDDVSRDYATKLARRTIDALLDLTKGRLYDELRSRRKDGLEYKERRVVLPADAEVPGETRQAGGETPATGGVVGD